jgi:hypothetical protein
MDGASQSLLLHTANFSTEILALAKPTSLLENAAPEKWPSGRRRLTRNQVNPYRFPGFESLLLRQFVSSFGIADRQRFRRSERATSRHLMVANSEHDTPQPLHERFVEEGRLALETI